ncbi:MAG: DNA repair protein RecO [Thermoleophilia bacterium]
MARTYSTEAIVMGSHKLRDADRVVTLFTSSRGKVPTVVKGVRKVTSRFGGRLEPFTHLQTQLHEGRNLHTLTGADTVRTHAAIRDISPALKAGLAFIDMINRATSDFERRPRTFNLLVNYLDEMDAACRAFGSGGGDDKAAGGLKQKDAYEANGVSIFTRITLAAELKLLLLAGILPHLADCAVCGSGEGLPRFSAQAGGALCENCAGESFLVLPQTLESMRLLLELPLSGAPGVSMDIQTSREVWRGIREISRYHLGSDLRVEPW